MTILFHETSPVEKLNPVTRYLEDSFPESAVLDFFDSKTMTQVFYLEGQSKRLSVRCAFFEDKSPQEIQTFLGNSKIARFLKNVESVDILVDEHGSIVVSKQ